MLGWGWGGGGRVEDEIIIWVVIFLPRLIISDG